MLIVLIIPFKANAECDDVAFSKIQRLASNINYSYSYKENNGKISFDVTFTNLNNTISIYDVKNNKYYDSIDETTVQNLKADSEYVFELYTRGFLCTSDSIRTIYVRTPSYNKYYSDELCKGIENYKYCQKWKRVNLNYNEFKNNVIKYRNSLKKEENKIQKEENALKRLIKIINHLYTNYYYIFLGMIIIISIATIIKKNNDSKLK